jgi:hypothetical protein
MSDNERVVARFNDKRLLKGYMKIFSGDSAIVIIEEADTGKEHAVPIEDLKAIFYVKTFEGSKEYKEKKIYGVGKKPGRKVFVKFRDGEKLVGFLEADVPPDKVLSFLKSDGSKKGFFLVPVDRECNNTRIFAAWNAIDDITTLP